MNRRRGAVLRSGLRPPLRTAPRKHPGGWVSFRVAELNKHLYYSYFDSPGAAKQQAQGFRSSGGRLFGATRASVPQGVSSWWPGSLGSPYEFRISLTPGGPVLMSPGGPFLMSVDSVCLTQRSTPDHAVVILRRSAVFHNLLIPSGHSPAAWPVNWFVRQGRRQLEVRAPRSVWAGSISSSTIDRY